MKTLISLLLLISTIQVHGQKFEQYYDYKWVRTAPETARYYALIEKKDSVWLRKDYFIHEKTLQMKGSFTDTSCQVPHGDFEYYHSNGYLSSKGRNVNGKKQGVWYRYHHNGMMSDSAFYKDDRITGTRLRWHRNGYVADSAVYNDDGSGIGLSWFDNASPSSAGRYAAGYKPTGKWQFFHRNGKLSALETYNNGKLIDKQYFDEEGNAIADTTSTDREASFPGGPAAWKKYTQKKIYFPSQYKLANADKAVVVVSAVIDEEGNVTDVQVTDPLHRDFDKIVVNLMQKSPKWIPAISHNRKVKYWVKQTVSFEQD